MQILITQNGPVELGDRVSFRTLGANTPNIFTNVTLTGVHGYESVRLRKDIDTLATQVYSGLTAEQALVISPRASDHGFIEFVEEGTGKVYYIAPAWIDLSTLEKITTTRTAVTLDNLTTEEHSRLVQSLEANGFSGRYSIKRGVT